MLQGQNFLLAVYRSFPLVGPIADGELALSHPLLDIPEAEAKVTLEPHSIGNDLGRKAVATILETVDVHRGQVCRILES